MEVAFIHPDLGLGGAEQLVVNLALSIRPGFKPTIFTPRFTRSFQPCHDGTLQVEQHGHFLPRSVFGRFSALMVYLRTIYCALWVAFFGPLFEAFVVDQVSAVVPLLKLCGRRVIFYCHFPDKALSGPRAGWARKCYRLCIDLWEELSLLCADQILVNSQFTQAEFYRQFPILAYFRVNTKVLYPGVQVDLPAKQESKERYFLSLNRYERKKNIGLALHAFQQVCSSDAALRLKIAGGYDKEVAQNVEHLTELKALASELGIAERVDFYCSVSNSERHQLTSNALAVLYTPDREHFGIVPCQAMALQVPVLACASGGPAETIVHRRTGFLLGPDVAEWKEAMLKLAGDRELAREMGKAGYERVADKFSLKEMGKGMTALLIQVCRLTKRE